MKLREIIRRGLPFCLSLCLILTLITPLAGAEETTGLTGDASGARAAGTYATSPEGVELIKEFEGLRLQAYQYNGHWSIGYGVQCDPADYPDGITEEEAEQLLADALAEKETLVNQMLTRNRISVSQNQFDALVSLTYNLGTQWMAKGYRLYDYLCEGVQWYTDPQVVNAFGTLCHSNGQVMPGLVKRRLREAYLFLYGDYDNDGPSSYVYIDYDAAGGTVEPSRTAFYPVGRAYGDLLVPTREGWEFLGWYTPNGSRIQETDMARSNLNVTARWKAVVDYSGWVNPYSDVTSGDWFFDYVRELSVKDILGGFPDGTFRANMELTTGQALKLILLAVGQDDPGNGVGHWAASYRDLAERLGYVEAGTITDEDLSESIDRLTVARITARAMGLQPQTGASPFADVDDGDVLALYQESIFDGYRVDGKSYFRPDGSITRAEMCAVVVRVSGWEEALSGSSTPKKYIDYYGRQVPVLDDVPTAPYVSSRFAKDGDVMYYNDSRYNTARGIDVSVHQGDIDWQAVADSGVEFAMIRVGYRGWGAAGTLVLDSRFKANLEGAKAAGVKVGVYFFSQAITVEEAKEEARLVLDTLNGEKLDYPVAFDWETASSHDGRANNLDATTLTDCALAFCKEIEQAGYPAIIYYNIDVALMRMELDRLTDYDSWLAQPEKPYPTMYYDFRIWQYSWKGNVPGIKGDVDMDLALRAY